MKSSLMELNIKLKSIAIFRDVLNTSIFNRLQQVLHKSQGCSMEEWVESISLFASEIYKKGGNLSTIVFNAVLENENAYVERKALKKAVNIYMEEALLKELAIFEEIAALKVEDFTKDMDLYAQYLPAWETSHYDFVKEYTKRVESIHKCGYGIYAKYHMFMVHEGAIVPIRYPDAQKLSDFSDYERERSLIVKNTEALLEGKSASNTLLYGDAGTGKSSTIKAIVNAYRKEGLRLVEVKKQQLYQIPSIIEELSKNPLKFILFIDDLSFTSNDENFAALKSILEGGVSAIGNNVVIYATSNRRHLIKEDHQSRMGDEVHLNDTLQETMSLSSRFGLTITFNKPSKSVYLNIVSALARQYGIVMDEEELHRSAEAYAIRHHGRSPRTAKQFIELLKAGI